MVRHVGGGGGGVRDQMIINAEELRDPASSMLHNNIHTFIDERTRARATHLRSSSRVHIIIQKSSRARQSRALRACVFYFIIEHMLDKECGKLIFILVER